MTDTLTEFDLSNSFSNGATIDWSNKKLWSTGSIPDDNSALVVFQALTQSDGTAKSYTVQINSCESFDACTIDMMGSKLLLQGSLTLLTGVNVIGATAEIEMGGGKLTADTLHLAGTTANTGIIGTGSVHVDGNLFIQSALVSDTANCRGGTLTVTAGTLVNWGVLEADSGSTLVVNATNFANYANGALTGGGVFEAKGGTLDLHTPGVITSDDASIVLSGFNCGDIYSFNTATGKYVALQSTLTTITANGSLTLESAPYVTTQALTDHGSITIDGAGACFVAPSLTIAAGGTVTLSGDTPLFNDVIMVKQLINDGTITIDPGKAGADIISASAITGTGSIVVANTAAVELTGSVANTVQFHGAGSVVLDTPAGMTGAIADFGTGDHITLATGGSGLIGKILGLFGLGGGSGGGVTYDYAGTASSGVLTLHEGSSSFKLAFGGDYTKSNFSVSADSHGIQIVGVGIGGVSVA